MITVNINKINSWFNMENFNFVIKGKHYQTEEVRIGKILDVWKMRSALSNGSYGYLYRMGLDNADNALIIVDLEAFFTVFCPQLIEDIKPNTIRELGIEDYLEIQEVYVNELMPWLAKIENLLKKKNDEK